MMDFERAMNVRVNGKEVNRFAINGVTIWEKYTPASILLTSDKSYASEGDTINLTATVNDKFNRGCPNKNVDFYICDQLIQSVEEPYEATRDAKYFLSEGDFTNKSIEFTVDAISGSIDILCEAATIRPFFRMTGLQVGDIVKITDDGILVKGYVNDTLIYTANHINNPGMIGFSLPNGATLTFSHFTEKGDVLIDSDMTDDNGVASVSYLVKDTNPLNIKAKSFNTPSNIVNLPYLTYENTGETDKSSDFTNKILNGATFTYNSSEKAYQISWSGEWNSSYLEVPLNLPNNNIKFSFDYYGITGGYYYRGALMIGLANSNEEILCGLEILNRTFRSQTSFDGNVIYSSEQANKWFHEEWEIKEGIISVNVYYNGSIIYSQTVENTFMTSNATCLRITINQVRTTVRFKNIKVLLL